MLINCAISMYETNSLWPCSGSGDFIFWSLNLCTFVWYLFTMCEWDNCGCRGCGVPTGRECSEIQVKFKIRTVMPPLTRSRGEYLRVVGIHSDGWKEREIYLVCSPFQIITVFQTRPNAPFRRCALAHKSYPNTPERSELLTYKSGNSL